MQDQAADSGSPPYRNLRVWVEGFELALDVFRIARRLEGAEGAPLGRRLVEASGRFPVAVARGQSSGSAGEFIKCLRQGMSDLSEMETQLLLCAELGYIPHEQVAACETRSQRIRKMAGALIRRLSQASRSGGEAASAAPPAAPQERPVITRLASDGSIITRRAQQSRSERGSALMIAVLTSAVLGLLGSVFLQLAYVESRISAQGRDRDQLLNIAEAGARAVKTWFDAPVSGDPASATTVRHAFLARYDLRNPSHFLRTRRLIDADGDPATSPVPADGTPGREWYRQGREVAPGLPHLDLFQKPYRRSTIESFLGTERGPDIVLEDTPGTVDLLDELNASLFRHQQASGRIEKIEIFSPSTSPSGPGAARLGVATVKITAAKYRALTSSAGVPVVPSGSRPVARSVLRMGLAEIPSNVPRGPLESCGDITAMGGLRARWGRVIAVGDIALADALDRLDTFVASAYPYASYGRRLSGAAPGSDFALWMGNPDNSVEDPWLKVVAGGDLTGWSSLPDQPHPYSPSRQIDLDHSNLFQRVAGVTCPPFDYDTWKRIATSRMPGDRSVHYFTFDPGSGLFREMGTGPARSVRDWTHGGSGIYFFDTADGNPPGPSNLTPPVAITGGDWSTAGVIYLNAVSFRATSVRGTDRVLLPPGEPFDDSDHDLLQEPGEAFVNLRYATAAGTGTPAADMVKEPVATQTGRATSPDGEVYERTTTLQRDPKGTPLLAQVNLFGVLFNSGDIIAEGDSVTYGSLVAGGSVTQTSAGADTPIIYFDERLNSGEWPPPEIPIPRTYVTHWQTSRP